MPRNDDIHDFSKRGNQPYRNLPDEEDYTYREPYRGSGRQDDNRPGWQGYDRPYEGRRNLESGQEFDAERAYTHRAGYGRDRSMNEDVDWRGAREQSQDWGRQQSQDWRGGREQAQPGTRAGSQGLRSRSADPGQSSYGGFRGEDPRYQRQQYPQRGPWHEETYGGSEAGWRRPERSGGQSLYRQEHTDWSESTPRYTPKGYKRSDDRIREDICEQLIQSGMDVREVSVDVKDGRVMLDGTVSSRRIKHAVEDCADASTGVTDVDNRLRIVASSPSGTTSIGNANTPGSTGASGSSSTGSSSTGGKQ